MGSTLSIFHNKTILKDEIRVLTYRIKETKNKEEKERLRKILAPLKRELYRQTRKSNK